MKFALKPIAAATLVVTAQLTGVVYAQASKMPAAQVASPAPAPSEAERPASAPQDWIVYDDDIYSPVVDAVSRHLNAARKAFDAKDTKKAAVEMRALAVQLKQQATLAEKQNRALMAADKVLLAEDTEFAQDTVKRLNESARKASSAAAAIESGRIKTSADLDKAIDRSARADMDRRWVITEVSDWFPVIQEPQRQFTNAVADYVRKDYRASATDIRKAAGFVRLEAGRATRATRAELDDSARQLENLAASVEKGSVLDERVLAGAFAKANYALAVAQRAKAAEFWARKDYSKVGHELKAAAYGLESAASWMGEEAKAGASAVVADARSVGDKLVSGVHWTRNEASRSLDALGNGIDALGQKIRGTKHATRMDAAT